MSRQSTLLAPYALRDELSAGRRHPEPVHPYRGPFQRDRDRIVHCSAFRRLAHKTQVFTGGRGDYHRTRLTHTLEVASIARTMARALRLNEDFVEALALLHDVGHPPFGHAGEAALDERLQSCGGFDHNRQALRLVERLEQRYPEFPGLNLSLEVLAGQQWRVDKKRRSGGPNLHVDGGEPRWPWLEVQVVDVADNIAYDSHDADDAVEAGLMSLADLDQAALWQTASRRVRRRFAALDDSALRRAVVHEMIDLMVSDALRHATQRLAEAALPDAAAARYADSPAVVLSPEIAQQQRELESLLMARVYRHPLLLKERAQAMAMLGEAFDQLQRTPAALPAWLSPVVAEEGSLRAAGDYLACLTDRTALELSSPRAVPPS